MIIINIIKFNGHKECDQKGSVQKIQKIKFENQFLIKCDQFFFKFFI